MAQTATVERTGRNETVSETVVSAVAEFTGTDPVALQPLYETVDPDALDTLFEADRGIPNQPARRVTFTHSGCDVVVSGDGSVQVSPAE